MAFGDTKSDILQYRHFVSGDHLVATPRQIGASLAVWQAYNVARREVQSTPHPAHTESWARQYEVGLAWVYVSGPKVRVTIFEPAEDRHLTLPVLGLVDDGSAPTAPEFTDTFAAGKAALGLS